MSKRKTDDNKILELYQQEKTQKEIADYFGVSAVAIHKRLKKIAASIPPESFKKLSEKEKAFVLAKAQGKNNLEAAMTSHDCASKDSAKSLGHELMNKPDIRLAVSDVMQSKGLTKGARVDVLKKHVYDPDPNVSLKALDQSWKLDGAYVEKHVHLNLDGDAYARSEAMLEQINARMIEFGYEIPDPHGELVIESETEEIADSRGNGEDTIRE